MDHWYLIALANLALIGILRLLSRTTHRPRYAPDPGVAAHRLMPAAVG